MHICYLTVGGCINNDLIVNIAVITFSIFSMLDLIEVFSVNNRIVYLRLRGIGIYNFIDVGNSSISGVLARCTGMSYDLRIFNSYEIYFSFYFKVFITFYGDSMDRLLIQLADMRSSGTSQRKQLEISKFFEFCSNNSIEVIIYVFIL